MSSTLARISTLINRSGGTIKVSVRTHVSPTQDVIHEFTIPPGGSETVALDRDSKLEAVPLDSSRAITPASEVLSPGETVVFTDTTKGVTLKNSSDVDIKVTVPTADGDEVTYTVKAGTSREVNIPAGSTITAVSSPAGTQITPSSVTIDGPQTVEFNKDSSAWYWDTKYVPNGYTNLQYSEGNSLVTSLNGNVGYYCAARSLPIPYSPAEVYQFQIEHQGSNYMCVAGPQFSPVANDAWNVASIPIAVPGSPVKITINLANTPRNVTFMNAAGGIIAPYGAGTDPNNQSHYPLYIYVALPTQNSWARISRLS